jgi:hypothetical protein
MQTAPKIVVTRMKDNGAREIVSELPFGSWGLKTAMGLAYELGEQVHAAGKDPSALVQIAIGELDWPAQEAIDDMIMLDAVDYPTKLGMLEDLFERFAPGFVETTEDQLAHLSEGDRETYAEISVGTEKQLAYAQGRFLEDQIRERRMSQFLEIMSEMEGPDVHPSTKMAVATLLIQVPKCSVFWIEEANSADIREMILSRVFNQLRPHQSRAAVRLGEQVDTALRA